MCILKACEKPAEQGVWWQDDTKWCLYSAEHQALIKKGIAEQLEVIDLGTIVSLVHPSGAEYVVNLQAMQQVAVSSGQKRPVMVVGSTVTTSIRRKPKSALGDEKTSLRKRSFRDLPLKLHYKDSGGDFHRYSDCMERALLQFFCDLAANEPIN